jgi:hypothetical protein
MRKRWSRPAEAGSEDRAYILAGKKKDWRIGCKRNLMKVSAQRSSATKTQGRLVGFSKPRNDEGTKALMLFFEPIWILVEAGVEIFKIQVPEERCYVLQSARKCSCVDNARNQKQ